MAVVGGSIHPADPRVGTGGCTCSLPASPQTSLRTLIVRWRSPRAATIFDRGPRCRASPRKSDPRVRG